MALDDRDDQTTPEPGEPMGRPGLSWFYLHAAKLQALIDSQVDALDISEWQAIWDVVGGTPVVATLLLTHPESGEKSVGTRYTTFGVNIRFDFPVSATDGHELAAWLGLADVEPDSVTWRRVDYGQRVGRKPGSKIVLPRRDVRLPEIHMNGQ